MSIELNAPRVIVIEDRGKQYQLTVARIVRKEWLSYFEGILSTSENQNGRQINSFDSSSARLELIERNLVTAAGYTLPDGVAKIEELKDWKKMLPLAHRLGAANTLIAVENSKTSEDAPIALGQESVFLDAVWGADSTGSMRKYSGLRHNFSSPTAEQQRRISRESSRSRVIGGTRSGKTVWLGAQATLAEIYDELVVSVDGYTRDGEPLPADRITIAEFMDTYHKVAAIDTLFAPAAPKVEEDAA